MSEKNLKFRRVKGRIIPISGSRENKVKAGKGVAIAAAGVAVAAAAGVIYRKEVSKSLKFAARGWHGLERAHAMGPKAGKRMQDAAIKFLSRGNVLGQITPAVRLGGIAAGSALIGYGVAKVERARNPKASTAHTKVIGSVAATTAFLTGAYGLAGARHGLKSTVVKGYDAARAVKKGLHL